MDGSSKNRLGIVKNFNEDENIPIFLVSLKAGGAGLFSRSDTVIHMTCGGILQLKIRPQIEFTDLDKKIWSLLTSLSPLNTIEEKILDLHKRKQGLVKDVVSRDEDAIAKLTWEEVLELLQT